ASPYWLRQYGFAHAGDDPHSEKIKILALLPVGRLLACIRRAGFLEPALETAGLVALELEEIIDEDGAELAAEERFRFQRIERGRETFRQHRAIRRVRFLAWRPEVEGVRNAVEPGHDLRSNIEIRIGCGLAHTVLDPRRRVARSAKAAEHHAAVVVAPGGPVGRKRIRAKTPVAVHGRRGEGRAWGCVL